MRSIIVILNKTVRRWNHKLEDTIGVKLEPHIIIACATLFVITLQAIIFLALSTQDIYCQLPALRLFHQKESGPSSEMLPTIYVITPTYSRHVQRAELTRLSQTLLLVPSVHWIIVEDSTGPTPLVSNLVKRLNREFGFDSITLLHEPTPTGYKLRPGDPSWRYPKGVWQRNKALLWLREHMKNHSNVGVVYFADDDNTYDVEIFNEMRHTKIVSVWPVGLVGGLLVERPLVTKHHKGIARVTGFNSLWEPNRPFPIDMAGFAINIQLVLDRPNASFSSVQRIGYVESHFLGQFVKSWQELEPRASECRRILVWHTKTKNPTLHEERKLKVPSHRGIEW